MPIDYGKIPESTMESLERWIALGIPTGDFLLAVLSNDLKKACGRADEENRMALFEIVGWLYNYAPIGCWGSAENVEKWSSRKRKERMACK